MVGIYCTYCPQELILAAGAIPVGLCGTREEPIAAAKEHLPRNLCPLIKSSYGFAELGAHVVAMENCSGYKTLELQTDTSGDDPIVALAEKYLQIPCSCMSPNPSRLDLLSRMLDDFRVDAVIDLTWQACHTYNIEAYEVSKLVKQKGRPYLHLESDYSNSDLESLKVRIEAMLEMVEK